MAIINADGLFGGDRLAMCSDKARLYWPYFFLASNGYGRLELNYPKIMNRAFHRFKKPPTEDEAFEYLKALDFGTCTGTTGIDIPVSAGTLTNLRCSSNAAGVNASSGVVTVRKNTVSQTMTCSFGVTTACSDTNAGHNITMAAGDRVGIIFTTQAAETLAQVSCSVEKQ
jgi:hypothetical protein